jgi:hypothetical protein
MKKKICAILVACYLIAGCSSGGGTSGAGGSVVTAGEFLLAAAVFMNGSSSIDSVQGECDDGEVVLEDFATRTGTFRITITNINDVVSSASGLFPSGIILESYNVQFVPSSPGAPGLAQRSYPNNSNTIDGSSSISVVVIVDAATVIPEYQAKNPSGTIHTYAVNVTMHGRTLSGDRFAISASMLIEFGDFGECVAEPEEEEEEE